MEIEDKIAIWFTIIVFIILIMGLKNFIDNFSFSKYIPRHRVSPKVIGVQKVYKPESKPSSPIPKMVQQRKEQVYKSQPVEWFVGEWGIGKPSAAEQLIINELNKYHIKWEREVSFFGLQLPTKGWARFDFLLVDHMICIEYDGKLSHNSPARKEVDDIKTEFCNSNNIQLIRYSGEHYYHMELHISKLMKELSIPIKRK